MEIVFRSGPWNSFFEGKSGEHETQLLFDDKSTVLSIVWDIKGKETVGIALEWLRVFATQKNPGSLIEKTGFDCLEIAKKESGEIHWFVLVESTPGYAPLNQKKIDREMEDAYFTIMGNEKKLLALSKAMDLDLKKLEDCAEEEKNVFFSSPIIHKMLFHKLVQEKQKIEEPQEFAPKKMISHGEFIAGMDKQKHIIKEPLGLFRRTLIVDGEEQDRLHAMHIMIESALLSTIPVIVFDAKSNFDGIHRPNPDAAAIKKSSSNLEAIGFPVAGFSIPEKIRINISMLDIEAVLELFRAGKTPAIGIIQKILSNNQADNFSQLIEAIRVQAAAGEATAYQLKKAVRIVMLIEKTYQGFFNGPNDIKEIAKTWGSGFGRLGLINLDGLDARIKTIFLHSLIREITQHYKTVEEKRPVKAMIFMPEAKFLFPRHAKWKIQKVLENDLQEASSRGIGSIISTEKVAELTSRIVSDTQSQISIVNQDDVGIRIENRKPYRVVLRHPLSECTEKKSEEIQFVPQEKK